MSWTADDIPNLEGKVAVVTGANGGLGLASAKALAGAGAHVVMGVRNREKAEDARREILTAHSDASLEIIDLDLGSLASVESAASKIDSAHRSIDILMNNAGLMAIPERRTEDGFEMQFGVNHLGHWALTAHLLASILAAVSARVVTVTSTAHHLGRPVDPENPHMEGEYDPWRAYARSKLANYHFALGLQREFEEHGARALSLVAHPGLTYSDLQKRTNREGGDAGIWVGLAERRGMSVERGALSQLRAATDQTAKGGQMYGPRYFNWGPPVRRPILRRIGLAPAIAKLWDVSEAEAGLSFDFDAREIPGPDR